MLRSSYFSASSPNLNGQVGQLANSSSVLSDDELGRLAALENEVSQLKRNGSVILPPIGPGPPSMVSSPMSPPVSMVTMSPSAQMQFGSGQPSYMELMQMVAEQKRIISDQGDLISQQQLEIKMLKQHLGSDARAIQVVPKSTVSQHLSKPVAQKWSKSSASASSAPSASSTSEWPMGDPEKWKFTEKNGFEICVATINKVDAIQVRTKREAVKMVKESPNKYFGCSWVQEGWSGGAHVYPRSCAFYKSGFMPNTHQPQATGAMQAVYQMLPKNVTVEPDDYTDRLLTTYQGRRYTSICPGRGHGVLDRPGVKIVKDINPRDVYQGGVGDCWLLSAISALAEFDGAIATLFNKRRDLHLPPKDSFNKYNIKLYDVRTWKPVDVIIDERLIYDEQRDQLLGCKPGNQADIWPCLIEKAVAAHCGGWDKIDGGQCTHAWRILTGCKHVYTIQHDGSKYKCYGAYNPNEDKWEQLANSPHDGFTGLWPMKWPEVGGGGGLDDSFSQEELFTKMCAWDHENFVMGAGTKSGSDSNTTNGIVDGHAYSVLSCIKNAGGTGIDMIKMRNPWGSQEFEKGGWVDGGPNWRKYPSVFEACGRPAARDDGVFWMQKENFFIYFTTIYLCAHDMAKFVSWPKSVNRVKKKPTGGGPGGGLGGAPKPQSEDTSKWDFDAKDGWQINLTTSNKVSPVEVNTKEEAIQMVKSNPKSFLGCSWIQEGYVGKAKVFPRSCSFFQGGFAKNDSQPDATGAMKATYLMLPKNVRVDPDAYTDTCLAHYNGLKYSSRSPGRGQGVFDHPGLKVVADINPGDVDQGGVGDCWLLSAISALAEFDDAITILFKGRRDLHLPPKDTFNKYTIQLYDLRTWQPVDVVIDERLTWDDQSGDLLGCKPGKQGDLWPCLLEKAVAAHCGGWDKIDGGQCTQAWRILTGCKDVYTIQQDGRQYKAYGAYNPNENRWEQLANSPHDGFTGLWPMAWPKVGGGGALGTGISAEELFDKMCDWDHAHFLMGAGTHSGSDKNTTKGIVDGHAYTILECIKNAGSSGFDMVKVRNPWGSQEFESGGWTDGGPNWERYPNVYEACGKPVKQDDGIFWMQKENFFIYFSTIYLAAHDMATFVSKQF